MRAFRLTTRRRAQATQLLLALLLLRAYVPAGFMPQSGHPLGLQLCPAGLSMPLSMPMPMSMPMLPADEHPAPHTDHAADCPFGHSPVAGPITDAFIPEANVPDTISFISTFEIRPIGVRVLRAHQARAPPAAYRC